MNCIYRTVPIEIKAGDAEDRSVFIASTASEDLAGDTIDPQGWVLDNKKKPFLWQHRSGEPPLGSVVKVWVEGKRLINEILWDLEYAFAKDRHGQMKRGFINTCSVGFWPLEWKERRDSKQRFLGFEFTKQILLELSLVNIPANPDAIVIQRSEELALLSRERLLMGEASKPAPSKLYKARAALAKHRGRAFLCGV